MPCLFHGGAETQFRRLFENLDNSYIAAIDYSKGNQANEFRKKFGDRIIELKRYGSWSVWYSVQTYLNIIVLLLMVRFWLKGRLMLVIYGAGTRWLLLYPIMKVLAYKILYSERNDGKHKMKFLYRLIGMCDVITTNSIDAKNEIQKYVQHRNITVINNGIIVPPKKTDYKFPKHPLKVLVPARISRIKDQMVVIDALWDVDDVEIHFAGAIDEMDYYVMLKEKMEERNCTDKYIFDGYIDNMMEYYASFSLVLLPSLSEGTANVLLESMALQIPCMASSIDMNARLVRNDAFLFDVGNSKSLKERVLFFINMNEEDVAIYINENYKYVHDYYSVEKMVDSFKCLISNIT